MQRLGMFAVLAFAFLAQRALADSVGLNWWQAGKPSNSIHVVTDPNVNNCKFGDNSLTTCGYAFNSSKTYEVINWHSYNGSNWLSWLNTNALQGTGATFSYVSASPSPGLARGDSPDVYLRPVGDNGYYLSTAASSLTLTFNPNHGIKTFSFYWGSVDGYNTLTLSGHDANGNPIRNVYTGNNICSTAVGGTCFPPPKNDASDVASIVLWLSAPSGDTWTSVQFSSSSPAFEFDNLEWEWSNGPPSQNKAPSLVPEPATLGMFTLAMLSGIAARLRKTS